MDIFAISIIMDAVSNQKNGMFALITTQLNWSVLLRGFEYLKYAGKMIKSPSQQGGGMGSSTQEERNKAIEKSTNKVWNFRERRKSM